PVCLARAVGIRLSSERQVTVLPLPVSPTMPSTSPARSSRSTPSTGTMSPAGPGVVTRRSAAASTIGLPMCFPPAGPVRRARSGWSFALSSQQVGEAVPDEAESDSEDHQRGAGRDRQVPVGEQEVLALGDHRAPLRGGLLDADAEVAEGRAEQHVPDR